MPHEAKFGALIDEYQQRDAIHVAIAPVIAAEKLKPGDHVGFCSDDTTLVGKTLPGITPIGIIDPFLRKPVAAGERCWLLLYQQTITSLRHEWIHPAFKPAAVVNENSAAAISKRWIENFASEIDQTYNALMLAAQKWIDEGDYTYDNSESYKGHCDKFEEFWQHYEVVTGVKAKEPQGFFTCSC